MHFGKWGLRYQRRQLHPTGAILSEGARLVWGAGGFTRGSLARKALSGPGLGDGTKVSIPARPHSASQQLGLPLASQALRVQRTCPPAELYIFLPWPH